MRSWFGETTINRIEGKYLHGRVCVMVKSERQENAVKQGETSSLFKFDENSFHDNNDRLTIHQSAVLLFGCIHGGKESKMRRRSNENGPVEGAEMAYLCHGRVFTKL